MEKRTFTSVSEKAFKIFKFNKFAFGNKKLNYLATK